MKIYRTTILPVVLCGCETWSVTLREKDGLSVLETRGPRKIFGPKRDEDTRDWSRLLDEELSVLHCSVNIIRGTKSRRGRWTGHVACM